MGCVECVGIGSGGKRMGGVERDEYFCFYHVVVCIVVGSPFWFVERVVVGMRLSKGVEG